MTKKDEITLREVNKNTKSIRKKNTSKTDKRITNNLKNWVQWFLFFLIIVFSILILVYVLALIFPCIRNLVIMEKIERIIGYIFSFILGGFLNKYVSSYFFEK